MNQSIKSDSISLQVIDKNAIIFYQKNLSKHLIALLS